MKKKNNPSPRPNQPINHQTNKQKTQPKQKRESKQSSLLIYPGPIQFYNVLQTDTLQAYQFNK